MSHPMSASAPLSPAAVQNEPDETLEATIAVGPDHQQRRTLLSVVRFGRNEVFGVTVGKVSEAWAARIAACVNACIGVPTAELVELGHDGGILALLEPVDQAALADRFTVVQPAELDNIQAEPTVADPFLPVETMGDGPFSEE